MSRDTREPSQSSSSDGDESDFSDGDLDGMGLVPRNKLPSVSWELINKETLGECKGHGNEIAKKIWGKEILTASDETMVGAAVQQVLSGSTRTMTAKGLKNVAREFNETQNDPNHFNIASSAGTLKNKQVAFKCSTLSQEGHALLVDKSSLPPTPNVITSLSKVGSEEKGMYYMSLDGDSDQQCFVCKLSFEKIVEKNPKQRKEKEVIQVKHANPREGILISDKPCGSDVCDEYVVFQVTHLYCSTNEETVMPEFKMPTDVPASVSLTPMWVLGAQRDLYKVHYVFVSKSKLKSEADEITFKKSLAEPSNLHDSGFFQGLVDSVKSDKTVSNHPGILAHHKLKNLGEGLLYKVTQVTPILNLKSINKDNTKLMEILMKTFQKTKALALPAYVKKNIFHVTGSVLKKVEKSRGSKVSKREDVVSYDKVEMNVYVDFQDLMKQTPRQKNKTMDLSKFLSHLKDDLVCAEKHPEYSRLLQCDQFDSNVIGFEYKKKGETKIKCFLKKNLLLEEICTDHYPFTVMEEPDDLDAYRRLLAQGHGDKYLDGVIIAANEGVRKFFTHQTAEFKVSDVEVAFYTTGVDTKKTLDLIIFESKAASDLLVFCTDCFNDRKELILHKFVCNLTAAILCEKEIDIGRVTDKILEKIGDSFQFTCAVEDPDSFYTKEITGVNAVRELVVAIVGTIAWTVTRLASSEPPDAVRIVHHDPHSNLQEYIQFVCRESGQILVSFQNRARTPCNFDPAVVIYYLGRTADKDNEDENLSYLELAKRFVMTLRQESSYKCKNSADKRAVPGLPEVFTQVEYERFDGIKFIPKHLDTVDQYRTVEGCRILNDEIGGGEGGDDESSEDDEETPVAGKEPKRAKTSGGHTGPAAGAGAGRGGGGGGAAGAAGAGDGA